MEWYWWLLIGVLGVYLLLGSIFITIGVIDDIKKKALVIDIQRRRSGTRVKDLALRGSYLCFLLVF